MFLLAVSSGALARKTDNADLRSPGMGIVDGARTSLGPHKKEFSVNFLSPLRGLEEDSWLLTWVAHIRSQREEDTVYLYACLPGCGKNPGSTQSACQSYSVQAEEFDQPLVN